MKTVLLIGLTNFGMRMGREMAALGHQIMAVDSDETRVNEILPFVVNAQIGDSTREEFLSSLGVNNYDVCVVAIDHDFQGSLETTSLLKELGAHYVVSLAERDVQEKFLLGNGADEVINPEKQMAKWAAIRYTSDHILDYIKLDEEHAIFEVEVPREWVGRSVGQIDIRKRYGINLMAVKEEGKMDLNITPDTLLTSKKTMFVLGDQKRLRKCFHV
ncbi:MAG: TrkA family potassium uptake protein [Lachnospiraceae bacterium]|nr:TrkA family potassium uptake protein [Lachnospiraceae bacterium]